MFSVDGIYGPEASASKSIPSFPHHMSMEVTLWSCVWLSQSCLSLALACSSRVPMTPQPSNKKHPVSTLFAHFTKHIPPPLHTLPNMPPPSSAYSPHSLSTLVSDISVSGPPPQVHLLHCHHHITSLLASYNYTH